jgi:hypothetical protein
MQMQIPKAQLWDNYRAFVQTAVVSSEIMGARKP